MMLHVKFAMTLGAGILACQGAAQAGGPAATYCSAYCRIQPLIFTPGHKHMPAPAAPSCWPYCRLMPVIFTKGHEASKNRETVASPKKSTAHPLPSETKNEPAVKPPLPTPLPARKVDLNTALVEEIQALPGMGPGMAAHILAGRPYADLDDLARNGVPLSLIEQIKPYIVLSR